MVDDGQAADFVSLNAGHRFMLYAMNVSAAIYVIPHFPEEEQKYFLYLLSRAG